MKKLLLIGLVMACQILAAQDSLKVQEKPNFNDRVKDKFNFTEKIEFFKHISSSKSKCETDIIDFHEMKKHNGKTIRYIHVEVLDPFGHVDLEDVRRPKFYNLANQLHQSTPERIVKQQLLFEEGDLLDAKNIYESGRTLYESTYFRDTRIEVVEVADDPSVVDVYILAQDFWSWTFWGEATDQYVGGSLGFNKFAGLPHTLIGGMKFNFDKENPITPNLTYFYKNIKGSFVDVVGLWSHDWRKYDYTVKVKRGFFSSKPQWAGSGEIGWHRQYFDEVKDFAFYNRQDFWLAKSFPFSYKQHEYLNIIMAGRIVRNKYTYTPYESSTSENNPTPVASRTSYLVALGVANRYFVREKNIFDFFEYRNLPSGFNMHFVGGLIDNSDHAYRGYVGVTANHSLMTCAGYFQEEFGAGTYINNGLEQITFHIKSKYFTHRLPMKKWGLRQYVYQNLTFGFLRPEDATLSLNQLHVRGLRNNYKGNSFYSLNLETEIQSPIKFMGFQARIFVFADIGIQGNQSNIPLGRGRVYQAYGIGTRLNNWKLGIGYLEFALVYYPHINPDNNNAVEFIQNYFNNKIIESNSLYNQYAVSTVN